MKAPNVTLAEIAAEAGVHVTTVSLALRNDPRLAGHTRTRLQRLAAEMGYVPDPHLRALNACRNGVMLHRDIPTIAYITNRSMGLGSQYHCSNHSRIYSGAQAAARSFGYSIERFGLQEMGLTTKTLDCVLYSRGIKGLLIASQGFEISDEVQLDWSKYVAVKIDYFPHEPRLHNVTNNQCSIARTAARRARAAGYRRLGLVMCGEWDQVADNMWTAGFFSEQHAFRSGAQIPPYLYSPAEPLSRGRDGEESPFEVDIRSFAAWFDKYSPDVILSKSSFVMPAIERLGLRIPEDIAFIDLFLEDDSGMTAGVRQNHEEVGGIAAALLASQLQYAKFGIPAISTTTFVDGTWVDGASCPGRVKILETNGEESSRRPLAEADLHRHASLAI